jgi:hypothetical protein
MTTVLGGAALAAQERPAYGPLGIVAVSSTESGRSSAVQFAKEVANILGREKKVIVRGEIKALSSGDASDEVLLKLAGELTVNWMAVVSFDVKDQQHGVFQVDLIHVVARKIASRVAAVFGVVRTAGGAAVDEIVRQATRAAHTLTAFVSQLQEVRVILSLLTRPGEAHYTLGKSDVRVTNKDGTDTWDTTQPVGKTTLRVMKAGYADATEEIIIPVGGATPYIPITKVVELKPLKP